MRLKAAYVSALFVLAGSLPVAAGPVVDAAQRAEALQAEGKTVEALDALDEAVDAIWTQSPLAFRQVELVESAEGPVPRPRADRTFRADDQLVVRVEPVGYGYGPAPSGATIGFTGDLAIENATGQVLTEAKDVFTVTRESPAGSREFPMMLSFVVPYVRPGDYVARFTIRDQNSDKTGSFEVPFTVAAPVAQGPAPGAAGTAAAAPAGTTNAAPASGAAPAQQ